MTQAQRVLEIRDIRDFVIDFITERGLPNMDNTYNILTAGSNLNGGDGTSVSGSSFVRGLYAQTMDLYIYQQQNQKNNGSGARAYYGGVYATDALTLEADRGWWIPLTYAPASGSGAAFNFYGGTTHHRMIIGQPNMRTLEQSFYYYQSGWNQFKVEDSAIVNNNVWPNIGLDLLTNGAVDGSTAGYWSLDAATDAGNRGGQIAFEGITDTSYGMPGETLAGTGMVRGGSSHPKGLMLTRAAKHNFLGSGTGSNITDTTWLWVDIDTGLAVGVLGVFALSDSDSTEAWAGPSIDKRDGFNWDTIQFVPDADSAYDRPKGELHFMFCDENDYTRTSEAVEDPLGSSFNPTTSVAEYLQVYDFNPFNQTGGVERVHNRRIHEGVFHIPADPLVVGGSVSLTPGSGARYERVSPHIFYHPPTRSYVNIQGSYTSSSNNDTNQPAVGSHRIMRWQRAHKDDAVSVPVPDTAVIENGASYFDVYVTTELMEPTSEHTVYFELFRVSTRAEMFDGAALGAGAYVVDNGVIDQDGFLEVRETNDVDNGGTLLVEGVDYTVAYSTGTLTPAVSWPADDIYVRYRHRGVPVTPGYGTLSETSAITDIDGKATAIVLLPDDLDGELIGLNVSTEAPF